MFIDNNHFRLNPPTLPRKHLERFKNRKDDSEEMKSREKMKNALLHPFRQPI
jgi:hypothetical protein